MGDFDIFSLLRRKGVLFLTLSVAILTASFSGAFAQGTPSQSDVSPQKQAENKIFSPPPMFGSKSVAAPDKAKVPTPDKSKLAPSAKSFGEAIKEANNIKDAPKNGEAKKTAVKSRKHIVDVQLAVWGRSAEAAEALAHESARKITGNKDKYLVKDISFVQDEKRVICLIRINFTDEIPENWYMESEVVSGFGKTRERAYDSAITKAAGRVGIVNNGDWSATESSLKNSTDQGVIPFAYSFEGIGSEIVCKIYFRYFKPR